MFPVMTGMNNENPFFFNMGVPISGAKVLHTVSSNPQPIVVEKLTGKYVTPDQRLQGGHTRVVQQEQLGAYGGGGSLGNAFCPRDMMNQALILAQLDMKKKKRYPENPLPIFNLEEDRDVEKVAKPMKAKQKSKVKVHEVSNRPLKNASVQFSSVSNQRKSPEPTPISQLPPTTNSPPTRDKEPNSQEIQHLQKEISKQLTDMKDLLENLIKECNNPNSVLPEEEQESTNAGHEQGALRALTRQVYIVQQQVIDVERNLNTVHNYKTAAQLHANKLDWTKSRLVSAYRGAHKSLQGMTNHLRRFVDPVFQLRLVDLLSQLLQSVRKLLDLYLQLTSLFSKNFNSACPELLDLVDLTDALQSEWQAQLEHKLKRLMSNGLQGSISPGSTRKKPSSKHSQNFRQPFLLEVTSERKSILQKSSESSNPSRAVRKTTKKLLTTKKPVKSVIFPSHIQIHRKPNEAFPNQNTYTQSTLSSRSKSLFEPESEGKSESPELRQSLPTVAENRGEEEEDEQRPDLPGFGGQPLASYSVNKMEKIGASIIEELLALDSERQKEREETKHSSPTVNDTRGESECQKVKSVADLHFTDEALKSIDLNLPPLEVLLNRLQEMEKEQIQIRSRWASVKYHDMEIAAEECNKVKGSVPSGNHQPSPPGAIFFSKKNGPKESFEIFQKEQPQRFLSVEFPGAIRFTKTRSRKDQQQMQSEEAECEERESRRVQFDHRQEQGAAAMATPTLDSLSRKPRRLFLSDKILKNLTENRQRFTDYLLNSAYHQVESFDPWRLTEELADSILEDCIQEVSEEMQDLSHDLVHHLLNNEFTQIPPPHRTQDTADCRPLFSSVRS